MRLFRKLSIAESSGNGRALMNSSHLSPSASPTARGSSSGAIIRRCSSWPTTWTPSGFSLCGKSCRRPHRIAVMKWIKKALAKWWEVHLPVDFGNGGLESIDLLEMQAQQKAMLLGDAAALSGAQL
jgi:hypothetical protein